MTSSIVFGLVLAAAGCVVESERDCPADVGIADVTGVITEGKSVTEPAALTLPHKVVVAIDSKRAVRSVTVGGQPARLTDNTQQLQRWEALLDRVELEANQAEGSDIAVLGVIVTDVCGGTATLGARATIALGPRPNLQVMGLTLDPVVEPDGECLPSGGTASARVLVTATLASRGAKVTLRASQGHFANGAGTIELPLAAAATRSEATTYFTADTPGSAILSASAPGANQEPRVLTIAGPPAMTGPDAPLRRGLAYTTTVTTAGNLDRCAIEEVIEGAATVTLTHPNLGRILGERSVRESPLSCAALEVVQASVRFDAGAPDGSAVTLRCFDTHRRHVHMTYRVEALPPPPP